MKLYKFQLYSSIPSYFLIFWHVYDGLIGLKTHFEGYPFKMAKFSEQNWLHGRAKQSFPLPNWSHFH